MKPYYSLVAALMLSACSSIPDVRNEYQGSDAGRVAIGIGASSNTYYSSYAFMFRKVGENNVDSNRFVYFQDNVFSAQKRDYDNPEENGVVQSFRLAPGYYEIFNFDVFLNGGTIQKNFGSKKDFSIPFNVRPNETTYLGNYQANMVTGKNFFGFTILAGAVFVVTDREKADLDHVKKRLPNVSFGPVSNATPKVKAIANPFLVEATDMPLPSR
ncbi:MAG: hypothetical protein HZC23_03715 [Rhodocyclales bacterium]|nr:hypothetical protein [Rhodocyclales bacterium]